MNQRNILPHQGVPLDGTTYYDNIKNREISRGPTQYMPARVPHQRDTFAPSNAFSDSYIPPPNGDQVPYINSQMTHPNGNVPSGITRKQPMKEKNEQLGEKSKQTDEQSSITCYKHERLGTGSYGTVYLASNSNSEKVAIKSNYADNIVHGVSAVREISAGVSLAKYPFIVGSDSLVIGNPFRTPLTPPPINRRHDPVYMCSEVGFDNLRKYILNTKCLGFPTIKNIMSDILRALVYMWEGAQIVHHDIKPDNVIMCKALKIDSRIIGNGRSLTSTSDTPVAKLADFGLAKVWCGDNSSERGITSAWYRAPEAAMGDPNYDHKVDVWAVGCIFYEMIMLRPMIYNIESDQEVIQSIIDILPYDVDRSRMDRFGCNMRHHLNWRKKTRSMDEFIELDANFRREMQAVGALDVMYDFARRLLAFYPEDRMTAREALNHPFFQSRHGVTDLTMKMYPPIGHRKPIIQIVNNKLRVAAMGMANGLLCNGTSWCSNRALIHAIYLFDAAMEYGMRSNNALFPKNGGGELILSEGYVILYFITILYMMSKYFVIGQVPVKFGSSFEEKYHTEESLLVSKKFEMLVLQGVCKFNVYYHTIYEEAYVRGDKMSSSDIKSMITYTILGHHKNLSVDDAYKRWNDNRTYYVNSMQNQSQTRAPVSTFNSNRRRYAGANR